MRQAVLIFLFSFFASVSYNQWAGCNFNGTWDTDRGKLMISGTNEKASGSYEYNGQDGWNYFRQDYPGTVKGWIDH